jgi:hypothetical protein
VRSRVRTCLLLACLAPALPAAAHAASYAPPPGSVFNSGIGGYDPGAPDAFGRQAGKHPAVYQYFVSWRAGRSDVHWLDGLLRSTERARSRTMFAISTKGTRLTPAGIARGEGDAFLLALNRLLTDHGHPVYLRLLSEMNNGNNPYSAYTLSGRSRGRAYSTGQFKRAWRRAVLVVRGGDVATVDRGLGRLGMPPVRTAAETLGRPKVAFMWVPLSYGNPEIPRNHPRHWWPGSRYVDWVGTTWYSPFLAVRAIARFYRYPLWRRKPFAFGEYGVWGAESPRFLRLFFGFVRSHPRVGLISYYQSANLERGFRLSTHPQSRAVLRRLLRSPRFLGYAPEFPG